MQNKELNYALDPKKWVDNYSDYLYNYAYYRVNNQALAEDLVQDTFLAGINARETYKALASEKTWLVSILKNKIIDHYKKASTKNESPLQISSAEAPAYDYFFNKQKMGHWRTNALPKEWGNTTETQIETKEFFTVLEKCLEGIPKKWQGIFKMSLMEEKDSDLVCKEFNLSSSNFWVIIHRAKLQIRECLEKNWLRL